MVLTKKLPILQVFWIITKRSIKLFLVGLVLCSKGRRKFQDEEFPLLICFFCLADLRYVRIPGVLQRFSISYFLVACCHALSLHMNREYTYRKFQSNGDDIEFEFQPWWTSSTISFHSGPTGFWPPSCLFCTFPWLLVGNSIRIVRGDTWVSLVLKKKDLLTSSLGPGGLSEGGKYAHCVGGAANKLDRILFTENHLYRHFTARELYDPDNQYGLAHDPEGFLGFTNSVLLTIIGLQIGKTLLIYSSTKHRLIRWGCWFLALSELQPKLQCKLLILRISFKVRLRESWPALEQFQSTRIFGLSHISVWLVPPPLFYSQCFICWLITLRSGQMANHCTIQEWIPFFSTLAIHSLETCCHSSSSPTPIPMHGFWPKTSLAYSSGF